MTEPRRRFGDIRDVLVALPHGDPYGGTSYVQHDIFTVRHELIRALEPAPISVFEFGALYGYFLVTALDAAPSIERVGWVDDESHTPGSNEMCLTNLRLHTFGAEVRPRIVYSESIEILLAAEAYRASTLGAGFNYWTYDLVSVDSDHSYDGCLADLHAAHRLNPRWIFVDDWTADGHRDDIQRATGDFIASTRTADVESRFGVYTIAEHVTSNGLAVLTRKEHA